MVAALDEPQAQPLGAPARGRLVAAPVAAQPADSAAKNSPLLRRRHAPQQRELLAQQRGRDQPCAARRELGMGGDEGEHGVDCGEHVQRRAARGGVALAGRRRT